MRHRGPVDEPGVLDPVAERERPWLSFTDLDEPWDVRPFGIDEREPDDWDGAERWIG